jgi:hypothetical protein
LRPGLNEELETTVVGFEKDIVTSFGNVDRMLSDVLKR